jgi:transcriptional regulator with XRE-family HTH domain
MTTENRNQSLGDYVRARRESRKLDYYEAAAQSGLNHTFWRKLEDGLYEAPSPKSLRAIGNTLRVPIEDLYALAGYDLPVRLPSLRPYLRARYHLPHEAVADLERYFQMLRSHYGIPDDQPVFPPKRKSAKPSQPRPNRKPEMRAS